MSHMANTVAKRPAPLTAISGVRSLVAKYKGVLLDQFGVLHDGKHAYPQAVEAVQQWADAGVQLYILSNSSRRANVALDKIAALGFDQAWFAGAMTSGEVTHRKLSQPDHGFGRRCLHITWGSRGAVDIASLQLEVVTQPDQADFVLVHGTEGLGMPDGSVELMSLEELKEMVKRCGECGAPPMVLANPDIVTVSGSQLLPMPGSLGTFYQEECGGTAHRMGKPDPIIYEIAMHDLGLPPHEVLAVGDSTEHDIAGAAQAGIDSLFVCGGIHEHDFDAKAEGALVTESGSVNERALSAMFGAWDDADRPRFAMRRFAW